MLERNGVWVQGCRERNLSIKAINLSVCLHIYFRFGGCTAGIQGREIVWLRNVKDIFEREDLAGLYLSNKATTLRPNDFTLGGRAAENPRKNNTQREVVLNLLNFNETLDEHGNSEWVGSSSRNIKQKSQPDRSHGWWRWCKDRERL